MHKKIQNFLKDNLSAKDFELTPIKKGGSDREFFRVRLPDQSSFIFMRYGTEVEENSCWLGINDFLSGIDISVPRIIAQDKNRRFVLMEDLGDVDLCSQASLPWEKRRDFYHQALTQIRQLHSFPPANLPADLKLSPGYGMKLYKWEHEYFIENFAEAVCHLKLSSAFHKKLYKELDALAGRMLKAAPCLIHRDFQSQNIMIKNNQPVSIDFQGMRLGNLFYDLGSLICDPYVKFTTEERNELISFYYKLMPPSLTLDEFRSYFWEASAQRLMQALGAYGFLGLKKNKPDFLNHIDNGIKNLAAASQSATLSVLHELAEICIKNLSQKNS